MREDPGTDAADPRTPRPPDTAHLDQLRAATERAAATATPLSSPHAGAPEALLARADAAMYVAKRAGRHRWAMAAQPGAA